MSTKQTAREAQMKAAEAAGADPEVLALATSIYDAVDALTPEQRTLAVHEFLGATHFALGQIAAAAMTEEDREAIVAAAMVATSMLAVAGYANAVHREDDQQSTVEKDSQVNEVLGMFKDMQKAQMMSNLSPETKARLDAGETPEQVMASIKAEFEQQPQAQTPAKEDGPSTGLYL